MTSLKSCKFLWFCFTER